MGAKPVTYDESECKEKKQNKQRPNHCHSYLISTSDIH